MHSEKKVVSSKKLFGPLQNSVENFNIQKKIKASLHHIRDLQKTAANMTKNRCNIYDNK